MSTVMIIGQPLPPSFFTQFVDMALITIALISTAISLLIPCLYYVKKQCQEHPTVLIANISLLESIANFNIVLMAINIFEYQNGIDIKDVFHAITFNYIHLPSTDQNNDFCVYNYCIYMLVQLLSISFHICYAIDLFLTIKFPFFTGQKRRKYYYIFSAIFPMIALANSYYQASDICQNQLSIQSIFKVPFAFLITLVAFCVISLIIVLISFKEKKSQTKIRRDYINHHRIILCILVSLWIPAIWVNFKILQNEIQSDIFDVVNKISFFCMVSSTGIINVVRMIFDPYLRQKVKEMVCCKKFVNNNEPSQQDSIYFQKQMKKINNQIWNLPLTQAMNQFQSQQIVHNIIQVVCQACAIKSHKNSSLKEGNSEDGNVLLQCIQKNSIIVESQRESQQGLFFSLFNIRKQIRFDNLNPHGCTLQELQQISKSKRKFNMVCMSSMQTEYLSERLGHKTVHIKTQQQEGQPNQLLSIKVTSYSHRIFQTLRQYDNLSEQNLNETLDLYKNIDSIKKTKQSLGASGSFFFFSFDHKIVIKTISQEQKDRFVQIIPYYFDHIRYNQNSLLARTYGIFAIEIAGISKIYFIMMENTFKDLQQNQIKYQIYDLKGSTVQRQVKDLSSKVLKDINYLKSQDCFIYMSKQNKIRFIDQVTKDIDMLKKHNIMDYSLLLGVGKSKAQSKKKKLYKKGTYQQKRLQNFRYITDMQDFTKRIYSISLIDYLQEFNFNKKLQLWLKKVFKGGGDISSIGTDLYYDRFLKFLNRIIVVYKVKFQINTIFKTT